MAENAGEAFLKLTTVDNTEAGLNAATNNLKKFQAEAAKPINVGGGGSGDGGGGKIVSGFQNAKKSVMQTRESIATVVAVVNTLGGSLNASAAAFDLLSSKTSNVGESLSKLKSGVSAIPGGGQLFELADGFIGATAAAKADADQQERNAALDKKRKEQIAGYARNLEQVEEGLKKIADTTKKWNTEAQLSGLPEQTAALSKLSTEYLNLKAAIEAEFDARKKAAGTEKEEAAIEAGKKKALADLAAANDARIAAEQAKVTADIVKQTGEIAFQNSQANLSKQQQLINEANRQFQEAKKALAEKTGIAGLTEEEKKAIEANLAVLKESLEIKIKAAKADASVEERENLEKALEARKELAKIAAQDDPVSVAAENATAPIEALIKTMRDQFGGLSAEEAKKQAEEIRKAEALRLKLRKESIAEATALQKVADKERAEQLAELQQDIADASVAAIQAGRLSGLGKTAGGFSSVEIRAASQQGFVDPIVSKQEEANKQLRKANLALDKFNAKKGITWQ